MPERINYHDARLRIRAPMTDTITARPALRKAPTGIPGLDEITHGGLPAGRPTLVCGGPGSGKTLLGISFLVNGAVLTTSLAC